MNANQPHYLLEVIQVEGPRRGINMTGVEDAEHLAEQWVTNGIDAVTVIASGPNEDSFSIRTFRSRNGKVSRTAWRTWINTRFVGDRDHPISIDEDLT